MSDGMEKSEYILYQTKRKKFKNSVDKVAGY